MSYQTVLLLPSDDIQWVSLPDVLSSIPGVRVVGSVSRRHEAVEIAETLHPDAIVAADHLDGQSTMPLLRQLRPRLPKTSFILLGHEHDPDELLALSEAGISAYLHWRNFTKHTLTAYLTVALDGKAVLLSEPIARDFVQMERTRLCKVDAPTITEREHEVLRGLAEGLSVSEIAALTGIGQRSVERAIETIKEKLGASSRETPMVRATLYGFVP